MNGNVSPSYDKINKSDTKKSKRNIFSRFFLGYQSLEQRFSNSFVYRLFSSLKSGMSFVGRIKQRIAAKSERSVICNFMLNFSEKAISVSLRSYAIMAFFAAVFSIISKIIIFSLYSDNATADGLLQIIANGFVFLLLAGFLCMSNKSLYEVLSNSTIVSFLLFDIFNFERKKPENIKIFAIPSFYFAIFGCCLGIVFGFIPESLILTVVFFAVLFLSAVINPEAAIIFTFFVLPFSSGNFLFLCVSACVISVWLKVLRNKRVMKFSFIDALFLMFLITVLLSGVFGISHFGGFFSSLKLILLLVFGWVVSNTVKTTFLAERCVKALIFSTSVSAAIGVLISVFELKLTGFDNDFVSVVLKLLNSIPFVLNSGNSEIVVLVFPFALSLYKKSRIAGGLCSFVFLLYIILSMDISLWISVALVSILYLCFIHPHLFLYFGIVISLLTAANFIFPELFGAVSEFINRITDFELFISDSFKANLCGIKSIGQFAFSGAGAGESVINHVFECINGFGSSSVSNSCSLLLRVVLQYGAVGAVILSVIYFSFVSNCMSLFYADKFCKEKLRMYIISCLAACSAIFLKGTVFSSLNSVNTVLCLILIVYLSFSFRKSSLSEFVPAPYDTEYIDIIM